MVEACSCSDKARDTTPGLRPFGENLWVVEGPPVRDTGLLFTTRMVIARLSDGSLWIESPVPVSYGTLRQITSLGPPRYLVAGTPRHVWRLKTWHALFPDAELWASRRTPVTLQKGALPLTGILGDAPHPGWADDLDQLAFKGSPWFEEVLYLHRASRTLLLNDLVQIHAMREGRPLRNALSRLGGVAAPHGGVPTDIRLSFIRRGLARQSLDRLLSWDFDRVIIAHGPNVVQGGKVFIERAFRWLAR